MTMTARLIFSETFNMKEDNEWMFDIIRAYSKVCSICASPLDIDMKKDKHHMPFCRRCRGELASVVLKRIIQSM